MLKYIHTLFLFLILTSISAAQNWQIRGKMLYPVAGGEIFTANSSIYIIGGYSDSLQQAVDWIQVYEPAQNSWRIIGHLISPRRGFVADMTADSSLLICGGVWENSPNISSIEQWKFRANEAIGPNVQSYNDVFNRIYSSGHIYNGHLFLFGGFQSTAIADTIDMPYIVRYDLTNSAVTRLEDTIYNANDLPYHMMSVRLFNTVYLFGGVHYAISNRIFAFNLDNSEYQAVGKMLEVRAGGSAVLFDDTVYLIGGYNESGDALSSVDIFATGSVQIRSGPQLNFGRIEPMAVRYGDEILIFGGRDRYNQNIPWIEAIPIQATTSAPIHSEPGNSGFSLEPNFPNPFNASTTISFTLPRKSHTLIDIYSVAGEHVVNLYNGYLSSGRHRVRWNSRDKFGSALASGIYIYKLQAGAYLYTRKMILIR